MIKNNLKAAFRNLWKQKSASFINITGLSLGMAAAVLIMLWVQNELNFDNYHPHVANIYYVNTGQRSGEQKFSATPLPLAETIKKQLPGIEETTTLIYGNDYSSPVLNVNDKLLREKSLVFVDRHWFNFFHYEYTEGNATAFNQNANSVILTESL